MSTRRDQLKGLHGMAALAGTSSVPLAAHAADAKNTLGTGRVKYIHPDCG